MKQDIEELITTRDAMPDDFNFIMATWLRGFYYGNFWFKDISKNAFMRHYHDIITQILRSKNTKVSVACLKEDPSIIIGYAVLGHRYAHPLVHWVHVKTSWRNLGICKRLIPENSDTATHMTAVGWKIKPDTMSFNPYKAFFEEE